MTARELYEAHHAALVPEAGGTLPFVRWDALTPREKAGWEYAAGAAARVSTATGDTERLRDLTRRLGFGDNITEPQADNDTIVAWFEQQSIDANEWQESQLWRNDCYAKGHPDDEDCWECDPSLRLIAAERAVSGDDLRDRVTALHPRIDEPRHGCCAAPKLCDGHAAECGGREHGLNRPAWPCPTMQAVLAASPAPVVARPEATVKAEALREAADEWDATWNRGHDNSVHPFSHLLRERAASLAADPETGEPT